MEASDKSERIRRRSNGRIYSTQIIVLVIGGGNWIEVNFVGY